MVYFPSNLPKRRIAVLLYKLLHIDITPLQDDLKPGQVYAHHQFIPIHRVANIGDVVCETIVVTEGRHNEVWLGGFAEPSGQDILQDVASSVKN